MTIQKNAPTKKQEIRNLLVVIGSAILAACLLSFMILYSYNPPGLYLARNTLLSPENLKNLHYSEAAKRGGDNTPFVFDGIDYLHYNARAHRWDKQNIGLTQYASFYTLISGDRSLSNISEEVEKGFSQNPLGSASALIIKSKRDAVNGVSGDFLKVDFSPDGRHYRVQLLDKGGEVFAYFEHEGILNQAEALFIP
jgi:hypothetical protein